MNKVVICDALKKDFKELIKYRKEFDIALPDVTSHVLIAKKSTGEILGFLEISYVDPKLIEIKRMAIRNKFKRIGIGRKLVGVARAIAINGNKKIRVNSRTDLDAQNFWKNKQGFKSTNYFGNFFLEELLLNPKAIMRKKKLSVKTKIKPRVKKSSIPK